MGAEEFSVFEINAQKKRPGGVDRALGKPTHGGDGSVSGEFVQPSISQISVVPAREKFRKNRFLKHRRHYGRLKPLQTDCGCDGKICA